MGLFDLTTWNVTVSHSQTCYWPGSVPVDSFGSDFVFIQHLCFVLITPVQCDHRGLMSLDLPSTSRSKMWVRHITVTQLSSPLHSRNITSTAGFCSRHHWHDIQIEVCWWGTSIQNVNKQDQQDLETFSTRSVRSAHNTGGKNPFIGLNTKKVLLVSFLSN